MVDDIQPDETLDARGLNCPMPVLKTKKAVDKMESGQILEVLSTDHGTKNDMPAFANRNGHEYLGDNDEDDYFKCYIKVK